MIAPNRDDLQAASPDGTPESAAPGSEDAPFMSAWLIGTLSGSRYVIGRDTEGVWWFGGENVANPGSVSLPRQLWRIETPTPWPPLLGARACLVAAQDLAIGDPRRVPGGGKITSAVQILIELPTVPTPTFEDEPDND